jgi:sugar phosphate permease
VTSPAAASRYRWTVLAVGTTAKATYSVFTIGLPVMLPEVRSEYGLTLAETGLLLAAANVGTMLGMLPWGLAADRLGERLVVSVGLSAAGVAMLLAGRTTTFGGLSALLAVAGLGGASVAAASGRAVMHWFPRHERGLAMGIRQSAIPIAGAASALVLPWLMDEGSVGWGFEAIGIGILLGAALAALFLRDAGHEPGDESAPDERVLRNRRTWLLAGGAALLLVPQIALFGFTVLFLHDHEGLSTVHAALVFACVQVLAVAARIGTGRWSDVVGSRIRPLRIVAVASTAAGIATALLTGAPLALLAPVLVATGVIAASWNGLAFAAAAEAVDRNRIGAALGVQQTVLFGAGAVVAPAFAVLVDGAGWGWGFALMALGPALAFVVLGRVRELVRQ